MQYGISDKELNKLITLFDNNTEIEQVILYGSRAKGNFRTGSDVDITLVGDSVDNTTLNNLDCEIDYLLLPYKFDISILHKISNIDLIEHIKRVGKILYKREHLHPALLLQL